MGEEEGEIRGLCAVTGLRSHWDHKDMIGWLTLLEYCRQGHYEGQTGKARRSSPLCEKAARMHGALRRGR